MPKEKSSDMNAYLGVSERLKELFPGLPRVLKVAATYMLEHPGDIATLSMRQVASGAGVSLPNFSRLAKALGYETYGELREVYRKQVQQSDIKEYHLRAENLQKTGSDISTREIWEEFRSSTLDNLTAIFESIDPDYFASVANVLNESRQIFVVGMQASASFSAYTHYLAGMASGKIRLVRGEGGVFADPIADIGEGDVMISISQQPCARASIELAILARERGAKVVAITDSPAAPISFEADYVLLGPNRSPLFFESYVGTTVLIEALIGFFTIGQSSHVVERIERIEADRLRLNEYWKDKKA
ncbi:MurR/RpiR family transcriptional regulator [Labrenzia sp. DG1229]|uniref:MurR/RpiR family transcriptional regulator n=1 Tax=Labrenzia sp. DG1229 TaxID=681847 RepID=UPI0012EB2B02|nr:MurR/RpiR family transcriptional regulator [Labrenzia sp. DG1229]